MTQSSSPLAPLGVKAAIQAAADPKVVPRPKIFEEFSLKDRVGIVSGGNRGLGLEMALALCELGARAIYCLDLPSEPSKEWKSTEYFVRKIGGRLEYVSADVRDQKGMWDKVRVIGDKEGRMDVCVTAAGIIPKVVGKLEAVTFPEGPYQEVMDTNVNGSLFTAQAAAQQMLRFGGSGSIIMISSIAGHNNLKEDDAVAYGASKSAVLQMTRSMACEFGSKGIRVNSISPGYIRSPMTMGLLEQPETLKRWSDSAPLGRIGRPDELRGVVAWLASDASSFCTGSNIFVSGGFHAW
ncbi:Sorbose reductase SOU1 [Termitomyces sp. T112]|nr:Sorbose reductase SOU1 [Termitomyces sp. T112]KNZ75407.1 Sorbose reductase SOU1 [Termitomyces sp. J132]